MIRRTICALAALLAGSTADASDIRRVVTGLDANNKSVVMFDSRMALQTGPYGLNLKTAVKILRMGRNLAFCWV